MGQATVFDMHGQKPPSPLGVPLHPILDRAYNLFPCIRSSVCLFIGTHNTLGQLPLTDPRGFIIHPTLSARA